MKSDRWLIAKNAASNVIRGGATAIVAVLLPHFMAHTLDRNRFAAWSLMLQIAGYASFLDFGLQATVARYIAQALELQQGERARKLLSTAILLLSCASLLAIVAVATALFFAPSVFPGIPNDLIHEFQVGAFAMALAAALQLPFSAYSGALIGMVILDVAHHRAGRDDRRALRLHGGGFLRDRCNRHYDSGECQ